MEQELILLEQEIKHDQDTLTDYYNKSSFELSNYKSELFIIKKFLSSSIYLL